LRRQRRRALSVEDDPMPRLSKNTKNLIIVIVIVVFFGGAILAAGDSILGILKTILAKFSTLLGGKIS